MAYRLTTIPLTEAELIAIPVGAEIIGVGQTIHNDPYLLLKVFIQKTQTAILRQFRIITISNLGEKIPLPDNLVSVGSYTSSRGILNLVFEEIEV